MTIPPFFVFVTESETLLWYNDIRQKGAYYAMDTTALPDSTARILLCVDSYTNGVLQGRFLLDQRAPEAFSSLSQCLLRIDALLNERGFPQSYTAARTFTAAQLFHQTAAGENGMPQGALTTFDLQIRFRQHASWQGTVVWLEKDVHRSFRSVLELITLLDSALRV